MSDSISDEAVYRTAPATPGLLINELMNHDCVCRATLGFA